MIRQTFRKRVHRAVTQVMIAMMAVQQVVWTPLTMGAENPNVVAGAATIQQNGTNLNVTTQTDRTIINWDKFNIPQGNTANFFQPGANSAVLNRVITNNNPSAIYGNLFSNGNVYLVNPSGIVVGPSGVINTNGFTASVLDIANRDFLNGNLNFQGNSTAGVLNQGTIVTGSGGATLIGSQVINEGLIESNGGNINLLTGGSVQLKGGGVYHQADQATIANGISETAHLIKNSGTLRATGALNVGGQVYLVSPGGTVIQEAIAKASQGENGGTVVVDAGSGTAKVTGEIDVSGAQGGMATVTGNQVELTGAEINASGENGGGTVKIGGGFQGNDPTVANSHSTTIDAETRIQAGAAVSGNGGTVIVWSDGNTDYREDILARGSKLGEGGFVEVSGKQELTFSGWVNTGGGTLLLDPMNFTINSGSGALTTNSIGATNLVTLLGSNNVSLQTSSTGPQDGNITVNSGVTWNSGYSLTLQAHKDITFNASVQNAGTGNINIVAGWDGTSSFTAPTIPTVFDPYVVWRESWLPELVNADNPFFGNNSGSVFIGSANQAAGVAVGSAGGQTNLLAHDLTLRGSDSTTAHAQLGFYHIVGGTSGATITTGPINVGLTGALTATAGNFNGGVVTTSSYVQIGHGGNRLGAGNVPQLNYTGNITAVVTDAVQFRAGTGATAGRTGDFAYAQFGNGGLVSQGSHSGNHSLVSGGNVSFLGGSGQDAYAQFGNGGSHSRYGPHQGDHTLTSGGNVSFVGGGLNAYSQFGNGGIFAQWGNHRGNLTLTSGGNVSFTAGTGQYAYSQLGNGGVNAYHSSNFARHEGTIDLTTVGNVTLSGQSTVDRYVLIGNGGLGQDPSYPISGSGNVLVRVGGNATLTNAYLGNLIYGNTGTYASGTTFVGVRGTLTSGAGVRFNSGLSHEWWALG